MGLSLTPGKVRRLRRQPEKESIVTLTPTQNTELATRLDTLDREVQLQIREAMPQMAGQSFTDLAGAVYDAGDESVATMIEELSHTHLERYLRELRQIERARRR